MEKTVLLKFEKGRYHFVYIENTNTQYMSWASLMARLFAGWDYDSENEILTVKLKYGNSIVQKDYDCEVNPSEISGIEYNIKLNKKVEKLFRKMEKDYLEFINKAKELEFEKEIFHLEY